MNYLERYTRLIRHTKPLRRADWLWNMIRPVYDKAIDFVGRNGLERIINGEDIVYVLPEFRDVPEAYEPELWTHLMSALESDDTVVDVGAYIGLYTIAVANRLKTGGEVLAFEPDPRNFDYLSEHLDLNDVADKVRLNQAAVGNRDGTVSFEQQSSESRVQVPNTSDTEKEKVQCVRLDTVLENERVDVLKIDVEGYEEKVLKGAQELLSDEHRCPRVIYIEVHPFAWSEVGASSDVLMDLLRTSGYDVFRINGKPVEKIDFYGEIVAKRN